MGRPIRRDSPTFSGFPVLSERMGAGMGESVGNRSRNGSGLSELSFSGLIRVDLGGIEKRPRTALRG